MAENNKFPRLRLLPLTIFAAALMLTVRVGDIVDDVKGLPSSPLAVSGAEAQEQQGQPPAADPAMTDAADPQTDTEGTPVDPAVQDEEAMRSADAMQEIRRRRPSLADDPTLFTQTEIDLLQQLAERRDQLDGRETELDQREAMMRAAETKIDTKVEQLQTLKATIEGLIKKYDGQQDEKLISLVKIYENMKPKDAAKIFEQLDLDTLLLVAERMSERKLAGIMAKMTPLKAKEVTEELYRLRQLPRTGAEIGG
ncbi:hypothetical protein JCM17960_30590 [Magnetospira thiophila]